MSMPSLTAERLWSLLPALHRVRDAGRDELQELDALFAEQFAALEENSAQLYDDLFIETCADWVAPYIGDLIGYRTLHGGVPAVASPRADVANTIAYRRRKGTATMLEQMARDVTGWPAHAVEFFEQMATTQNMNHIRLHAPATPDQKAQLQKLSPEAVTATSLAGEPILNKLTRAPENDAPIDGLKVVAASGWFAARPSGTEDIYKIYAESFKSRAHLDEVVAEAQRIVNASLAGAV